MFSRGERPSRFVVTWDITTGWQFDPKLNTEIAVRFVAETATRTRVEFEHRRLDRYGARRDEMLGIFSSDGGWGRLLETFVRETAT